jgi:hypothetical protein
VDLAYATTGHKSQGITRDEVLVRVTSAEDRQWLHIAGSRAIGRTRYYSVISPEPAVRQDREREVVDVPAADRTPKQQADQMAAVARRDGSKRLAADTTEVVDGRRMSSLEGIVYGLAVLAIPVGAGIGILKHRLYDIDRLINRTLVYGLLTVLLAGVYAGVVLALGQLFGRLRAEPPSWAVAGATLTVAAVFQPARRRIQAMVDRRFNRSRYDAAKTIEAFSARLRDEIDLDTLTAELLAVVYRPWSRRACRCGCDLPPELHAPPRWRRALPSLPATRQPWDPVPRLCETAWYQGVAQKPSVGIGGPRFALNSSLTKLAAWKMLTAPISKSSARGGRWLGSFRVGTSRTAPATWCAHAPPRA